LQRYRYEKILVCGKNSNLKFRIGRYTGTGPVKKDVDLSYQGTTGANLGNNSN